VAGPPAALPEELADLRAEQRPDRGDREAAAISQEELAQRMADLGFGFSQATTWKIERGQRPVKASELITLAELTIVPENSGVVFRRSRPGSL
jgi:transcriptional regulator with XRE-family HTH domain